MRKRVMQYSLRTQYCRCSECENNPEERECEKGMSEMRSVAVTVESAQHSFCQAICIFHLDASAFIHHIVQVHKNLH